MCVPLDCRRLRGAVVGIVAWCLFTVPVAERAGAAEAIRQAGARETVDLCGTWQAQLDAENRGECEGWYQSDFAASDWPSVQVPGSFAKVAPQIDRYEGVGWFRRIFHVPRSFAGRRVVLHFEGVNNQCQVWVNGQAVGTNPDAFLGFDVPLGRETRVGDDNVIVVRVDNTRRRDITPSGRQGWHPFGGILREVRLCVGDLCRIESSKIVAQPHGAGGSLRLQATIANGSDQRKTVRFKVSLAGPEGDVPAEVPAKEADVEAGKQSGIEISQIIPGIQAWSPAKPVLYTAHLQLVDGDQILDCASIRFGFRKIEARGTELYLNGEPLFLTGFNRHEDSPRTDMCPDHELTRKELIQIKEMGCNFLRLCHYPQHTRTLDLCDEIGLLAMGEIPLYMWSGVADGLENYPGTVASARRQLSKMIDRDHHHPAVIFWSVSNECETQRPEVRGTNVVLLQQAKRLDPTRLAVHVSNHWMPKFERTDSFGEDDVICVNGYPDPREGPGWWTTQLEELHRDYPSKPILVTEFGGEADRPLEWQIGRLTAGFEGTRAPYVCGIAIWCWADHPWDKTWIQNPISPYGLFSRDRQPRSSVETARRGFHERQRLFEAEK